MVGEPHKTLNQKGCNTCTRECRSACVLQGVYETLKGSVSLWCEVTTSSSQVTIPRIVTEDWFLGMTRVDERCSENEEWLFEATQTE